MREFVILSPSFVILNLPAGRQAIVKNLRVNSAKNLCIDPSPLGLRPRDNLWNPIKSWRLRRQGSGFALRMTAA